MAAGCTQPGGAGTTILIEDDTHGDAGGDGSYSFLDIATKFPADFVDLGTTPKTYRGKVSVTNGDGVGTSTTTLKDSNCTVIFDAGKTYSVSSTGRSNRFTEFGVKVSGTKSSGRSGVRLSLGSGTLNIQGNGKFYGSILEAVALLTVAPGASGLTYELYNCLLSAGTSISLGNASGAVPTAYNVDMIGASGAAAAVTNFNVTTAERITIGLNSPGLRHIQSGSLIQAKDMVLIGVASGGSSVRNTGASPWDLVSPTWDQGAAINDATSTTVNEWWPYDVFVISGTSAPIAGIPVTLYDRTSTAVVDTTTTATVRIVFGSGVTANCVKVVSYALGVSDYRGPFTARINQGSGRNLNWPQRTIVYDQPTSASWSGGIQYQDVFDIIQLEPPSGAPTGWIELTM